MEAWSRLKESAETKQRRMRTCFLESSKGFADQSRALLSESERKQKGIMQTLVLQPPATRLRRLTTRISQCPFFSFSPFPLRRQHGFPSPCWNAYFKVQEWQHFGRKEIAAVCSISFEFIFYLLKKEVAHTNPLWNCALTSFDGGLRWCSLERMWTRTTSTIHEMNQSYNWTNSNYQWLSPHSNLKSSCKLQDDKHIGSYFSPATDELLQLSYTSLLFCTIDLCDQFVICIFFFLRFASH